MRLTREEIQEALRERHTNQMQDRLEQGKVAVGAWDRTWHFLWPGSESAIFI